MIVKIAMNLSQTKKELEIARAKLLAILLLSEIWFESITFVLTFIELAIL